MKMSRWLWCSGCSYLWRGSIGWCVSGMPASVLMGTVYMASAPSLRTIPVWVSFEEALYVTGKILFYPCLHHGEACKSENISLTKSGCGTIVNLGL
jgi:hypothetical protein